jgi:hypothetical protein
MPTSARIRAILSVAALAVAGGCATSPPADHPQGLKARLLADPEAAARLVAQTARDAAGAPTLRALLAQVAGWHPSPAQASASAAGPGPDSACDAAASLPQPLGAQVAALLAAVRAADEDRRAALRDLPAGTTAERIVEEFTQPKPGAPEPPLYLAAAQRVDRARLLAGMDRLLAATETFDAWLAANPAPPAAAWRCTTPLGEIVVDTTGASTAYTLRNPLLVVDVGGNDSYTFTGREDHARISVLIDRGGNDTYEATVSGADPSAGVLGYGILLDTGGDDAYRAKRAAQGAGLLGVGVLRDTAGRDTYTSEGFAQGFALAGAALLVDDGGNDRYRSWVYAQGSAASGGTALLLDRAGDDVYALDNDRVVIPSSQLVDRNASMGQGAGRGLTGAGSLPAGTAMLADLQGNDVYVAQVFGQGVGYGGGTGLFHDGGGKDFQEAAWYAMGASAHGAVGILVAQGSDDDSYGVIQSTGLAAAHDKSFAVFWDEGGGDRYRLGTFGFGTASEGSRALFEDRAGEDDYGVRARCPAFGVAAEQGARSQACFRGSAAAKFAGQCKPASPAPAC